MSKDIREEIEDTILTLMRQEAKSIAHMPEPMKSEYLKVSRYMQKRLENKLLYGNEEGKTSDRQ